MEKIINGKKANIDIIGSFELPELGKTYALCSYDDDINSTETLVVIMEIEKTDDGINLISIPEDEKEFVLNFYETMKKSLLGDE